jgi:uncharacterized protein (DUF1697 family)
MDRPVSPVQIVLLRGINLGARNRVAMPALRGALTDAGFDDVRTYLQSGNVVLSSGLSAAKLADKCSRLIKKQFGLDIDVVVRTRHQLAKVVELDPLGDVASNPKRYQVSFLDGKLPREMLKRLEAAAVESERFVVRGREVYAWHPAGVARSKLWALLAGRGLQVTATSRNWTTVTKLLELADEDA